MSYLVELSYIVGKLVNCELTPLAAAPGTKDMDSYVQLIIQFVISSFLMFSYFLSQGLLSLSSPNLSRISSTCKSHVLLGLIYDRFSVLIFRSHIQWLLREAIRSALWTNDMRLLSTQTIY